MDLTAVKEAKDEELQVLGLIRRGDILALRAFADTAIKATTADKKRSLLGTLKEKFAGQRLSKKKKTETLPVKQVKQKGGASKVVSRKIRVGWQHFDRKQQRYISIRLVNGGGTRDIDVGINATKEEIIDQIKNVFFPEGKSSFGKCSEMRLALGNFQCEEIIEDGFTLGQYITRYRLSRCRLYLMTKLYEDIFWTDNDDELPLSHITTDSDDEVPLSHITENTFDSSTPSTSNLIGTSMERSRLLEDQMAEYNESLARDQTKNENTEQSMNHASQQEKALEDENLLRIRAAKVPAEPGFDDEHVTVSVRHVSLGCQTRRFYSSSKIISIYDWVRSLSIYPTSFTLSTCDIAYLDPMMSVEMVDKTLLRMSEDQEESMTDITKLANTTDEMQIFQNQSSFTLPIPTEIPPQVLLECDDM